MKFEYVVLFILLCSIVYSFIALINAEIELKKIDVKIIRNDNVYRFRTYILDSYPYLYDHLPSYDEMLDDNKPLVIESYFSQEEIVKYESNVH